MKTLQNGVPCRKKSGTNLLKYRILPLLLSVVAVAVLTSCTVTISADEPLTLDVSSVEDGYAIRIITAEPEQTSVEPEQTTAQTESIKSTEQTTEQTEVTKAEEPETAEIEFAMPFADKAHGGIDYKMTQGFSSSHGGMDFAVYYGNAILASADGTVTAAYNDGDLPKDNSSNLRWTYGTYVVITHEGGYQTCYAHLSGCAVSVGDTVKQGQIIGYSGNTGRVSSTSTGKYAGTHLHFEIRILQNGKYIRTDPSAYLPWYK